MNKVNFNKRRNSRSKIETFLYELRPFSLFLISVYSLIFPTHIVMTVCGGVLAVCAVTISTWRLRSRSLVKIKYD